jgi:hypothetical protein
MIGHKAIILIVLVVGASMIAAGVTIAYFPQNKAADSNLKDTTFTSNDGNRQETVKINLDNGMNKAEALLVAEKICGYDSPNPNLHHSKGSASVDAQGVWHVHYNWGLEDEELTHFCFTDIYPSNQTFSYSICD